MKNLCAWKCVLVFFLLPFAVYSTSLAAPTVSITSPNSGAVMVAGETVTITANATGGVITMVEFFVDGSLIGSDLSSPYSISWIASDGSQTITAMATDNNSLTGTSPVINITVNANIPPSVSIVTPTLNEVVGSFDSVNVSANAFDIDGSIDKVVFFDNGVEIGRDTIGNGGVFSVVWGASGLGAHTITAEAVDNLHFITQSAEVVVFVNQSPVARLTSPDPGDYVTGDIITFTAEAFDADGVLTKVEFFVGMTKVGEDFTSPYSTTWVSTTGLHTLRARATDHHGAVGNSFAVGILVRAPNNLPTMSIISPVDNAVIFKGETVTIQTNAVDSDGRIFKVEYFIGPDFLGEILSSPFNKAWLADQEGQFLITVIATDDDGATITKSANVTVMANPAIRVALPLANAIYPPGEIVTFNADALDLHGEISKVEFYLNGDKIEEDETIPYSITWPAELGDYSLVVGASNDVGLLIVSPAVTFKVSEPQGLFKVTENSFIVSAFPNPVSSQAQIAVTIEHSGETSLIVYNQLGKETSVLSNGYLKKGEHLFSFDTKNLLSGIYLIRLINNGKVKTFTLSKE